MMRWERAEVVILTAIELEFAAVQQVEAGAAAGSCWVADEHNGLAVALREFHGMRGDVLRVVVARAPDMGKGSAVTTLQPLVDALRPRCIAMAGVCAGRPGKTALGDVVAGERLFDYDAGKWTAGFQADVRTYSLPAPWKQALERFGPKARFGDADWWQKRPVPYEWQEHWALIQMLQRSVEPGALPERAARCPQWSRVIEGLWATGQVKRDTCKLTAKGRQRAVGLQIKYPRLPDLSPGGEFLPFKLHVAPIGSGSAVREDEGVWAFITPHMRTTLALEMEAAALADIVRARAHREPVEAVVMKGVMDFANHGRDDQFKEYAARASAECLIAFLRDQVAGRAVGARIPEVTVSGAAASTAAGRPPPASGVARGAGAFDFEVALPFAGDDKRAKVRAVAEIPALKRVWSCAFDGVAGAQLPTTIAPGELIAAERPAPRLWAVRQRGAALVFAQGGWIDGDEGSPVATIAAAVPEVWVQRGVARATRIGLAAGAEIELRSNELVVMRTDCGEAALVGWERPAWAVAAGRDRYGLWAAFEVQGVRQRVRWIPPGRFLMGSPDSETGRYDNEGPQHWVTITRGYWLGETPVTQALWTAVMGSNPSLFRSSERPVECVSWNDCQAFLARLDRALDGFSSRLPTEAEWERACRAGTSTATWVGDLMLRDENGAPGLDVIAWYGHYSHVEFELDSTPQTNTRLDKRRPREVAGTHPVGLKPPNPFGLYDMLGNVFEWCQDAAEPAALAKYTVGRVDDPVEAQGVLRVARGGAWSCSARNVRAANRLADRRSRRMVDLGLRLAGDHAAPSLPAAERRRPMGGTGRGARPGAFAEDVPPPEMTTRRRRDPRE